MTLEEFLKEIRSLEIRNHQLIKKGLIGGFQSRFKGTGLQFSEFRPYVYGDDIRHISWTTSARTNDTVLKIFEEERDKHYYLVVDISASARRGPIGGSVAFRIAEIAATLALSAEDLGEKVGLLTFSQKVEKLLPPNRGRNHVLRLVREILKSDQVRRGTDPTNALKRLRGYLKKQSVIFFLSDFERLPDRHILKEYSIKHEFLAIGIFHSRLQNFPAFPFIEMEAAESLKPFTVATDTANFHLKVKEQQKRVREVEKFFQASRIPFLSLNESQQFLRPLENFIRGP
jgi:uncharacterized protein (DUF58 family)